MSTSESPIEKLSTEARTIARKLKATRWPEGRAALKFGIVQDDKIITVTITTAKIIATSEEALTQWILAYMRGETPQ